MASWAGRGHVANRGPVVWAAWNAIWHDDVTRRLHGQPRVDPTPAMTEDLLDDERAFLTDLHAGRLQGSALELVQDRYGKWNTPRADDVDGPLVEPTPIDDARRRRGPDRSEF